MRAAWASALSRSAAASPWSASAWARMDSDSPRARSVAARRWRISACSASLPPSKRSLRRARSCSSSFSRTIRWASGWSSPGSRPGCASALPSTGACETAAARAAMANTDVIGPPLPPAAKAVGSFPGRWRCNLQARPRGADASKLPPDRRQLGTAAPLGWEIRFPGNADALDQCSAAGPGVATASGATEVAAVRTGFAGAGRGFAHFSPSW